jgi:hypothetical protein
LIWVKRQATKISVERMQNRAQLAPLAKMILKLMLGLPQYGKNKNKE